MNVLRTTLVLSALLPSLCAAAMNAQETDEAAYLRMTLPEEELVASATRAPKPLSQVAENVTVVTAEEIEAMNAHTLAEVLNRVTGVFVQFLTGGMFGDIALTHVQGSGNAAWLEEKHVALLVDGVPWTQIGSGVALNSTIPLGLIDRIEILKGPASSTWGSALGGVINVLTKKTGTSSAPRGQASLSYGERRAYDGRAEAAGAAGIIGYYLEGEAQGAEWQRTGAEYRARSLFGKIEARPTQDLTLGLTLATSRPETKDEHSVPTSTWNKYRTTLANLSADARLSPAATLNVSGFLQTLRQDSWGEWDGTPYDTGDAVLTPPAGEIIQDRTYEDQNRGAQARLTVARPGNALVVGAEYFRGREENTYRTGPTAQTPWPDGLGWSPSFDAAPSIERWGVYANDTWTLGPLTLTPGLRFDDTSRTEGFTSPSLGAVLRAGPATLLRAQVARGFSTPPLNYQTGDVDLAKNPDLEPETVWSWQGGVETAAVPGLLVKLTAFRHEVKDSLEYDWETNAYVNGPAVWRTGLEAEAETSSFGGFSARSGFAWVRVKRIGWPDRNEEDLYQSNLGLAYRRGTLRADLFGHFVWWDLGPGSEEGKKNDWLWDLTASKTVLTLGPVDLDLFAAAHNLFNGRQYLETRNPSRWLEGGARVRF